MASATTFSTCAFLFLAFCAHEASTSLRVDADEQGSVVVSVGGEEWFRSSGKPWVREGLFRGRLSLKAKFQENGSDPRLGSYIAHVWQWEDGHSCKGGVVMQTELRRYDALTDAAVFVQAFPCAVTDVKVLPGTSFLGSGWPQFEESRKNLSWATFNGFFAYNVDRGVGLASCKIGTQGGTPLMLYDEATMRTLVISQFTRVKTGEMDCHKSLTLGLKGTLTSIPQNFSASWIIKAGVGISQTMQRWGDVLLRAGGKQRVPMYNDEVISSLGYWTDNGAYYHYPVIGPTTHAGGYQTEIEKVNEANKADRLPFRHWQLDSWWYQKGKGGNGSSRGKGPIGPLIGMYQWVADPFVFPNGGMEAVQKALEQPLVLHNRWFGPDNWYKQHGIPSSGWTDTHGLGTFGTLPLDGDSFWNYFFGQQKGYGLKVYEQDFLWTQYDLVPALRRNATLADDWLRSMADAAKKHNLTIQYCMPYPRDYLASTQHTAVTTIRATNDYKPNNENWRIARQSLLAHAVGLLPFKDTFLSGGSKQDGAANPGPELSPELQTLVSVLSGAMVGPGDGPHMGNRTRLMQTCMEDGVLLKADRPAVPIDAAWTSRDPGGELSWSISALPDGRSHRYVMAAALQRDFNLSISDLEASSTQTFVARNWHTGEMRIFNSTLPLPLKSSTFNPSSDPVPFEYWTIAEARHGWVLLGEMNKFITVSSRRIKSMIYSKDGSLNVVISGVKGEKVSLCALQYSEHVFLHTPLCNTVAIGTDAESTITFQSEERRIFV